MVTADMFMKIEGGRSGAIKGEALDATHRDEIEVKTWSWGMRGNASSTIMSGSKTAGANQVTVGELIFTKSTDTASTGLMAALRSNEIINKAVLTVRKAGGTQPVEYLKISLANARIRSIDLEGSSGGVEQVVERVSIGFQKISVEYIPQASTGGGRGTTVFETDVTPA